MWCRQTSATLIFAQLVHTAVILTDQERNSDKKDHGRETDRSSLRCSYNLVINELDSTKCPTVVKQENQGDTNKGSSGPVKTLYQRSYEALQERVSALEQRILREALKNRNLESTVLRQQTIIKNLNRHVQVKITPVIDKKLKKLDEEQKKNSAQIKIMSDYSETRRKKEREHTRNIENKLAGVMLNVAEMNHALSFFTKQIARLNIPNKHIPVKSIAETHTCGIRANGTRYRDCEDVFYRGHRQSGVYYIMPIYSPCPIPVYCDMETPPGGWLLIQRRLDGTVSFNRKWDSYRRGFGDVSLEHWLGNDNIFLLTNQLHYELRVDLWDFYGSRVFAVYKLFKVDGERDQYQLHIANHTGTAPDGFSNHNNALFSTPDHDNDQWPDYHCAREWRAGWWFNNCWFVILNGQYHNTTDVKYRGISWNDWKAEQLSRVEMKIRPAGFV